MHWSKLIAILAADIDDLRPVRSLDVNEVWVSDPTGLLAVVDHHFAALVAIWFFVQVAVATEDLGALQSSLLLLYFCFRCCVLLVDWLLRCPHIVSRANVPSHVRSEGPRVAIRR